MTTNPRIRRILIDARTLVANPMTWTTHNLAIDSKGNACNVDDPDAQCFCALGAVNRSAPNNNIGDEAWEFVRKAAQDLYDCRYPVDLNDGTHEVDEAPRRAIVNVFNRAIEIVDTPAGWSHAS
jgi:hypothetical protein